MTKTRDEVVEIMNSAYSKSKGITFKACARDVYDALITAGVIPQPSDCNKSTVHLVGTRHGPLGSTFYVIEIRPAPTPPQAGGE